MLTRLDSVRGGSGLLITQMDWPQLDQAKYPNIRFWTLKSYTEHLSNSPSEGSIKTERVRRGLNADLGAPRANMSFVEDETGASVIEADARLITSYMRRIFVDLHRHGEAPAQWGDISSTAAKYVYQEMYRSFPELQLCKSHWKIDKLGGMVYSGWYRKFRQAGMQDDDETEDQDGDNDDNNGGGGQASKRKQPPTTSVKPSKGAKQAKIASVVSLVFLLSPSCANSRVRLHHIQEPEIVEVTTTSKPAATVISDKAPQAAEVNANVASNKTGTESASSVPPVLTLANPL